MVGELRNGDREASKVVEGDIVGEEHRDRSLGGMCRYLLRGWNIIR